MPTYAKRLSERDGEHGGMAFTVTKPLDLAKLDRELTEAMFWRGPTGIVGEGDPATASPEHPVVVWVLRDDVDINTFKRVVTAHDTTPDPNPWGTLLGKAEAGTDLTGDEMQQALRLLIQRSAGGLG